MGNEPRSVHQDRLHLEGDFRAELLEWPDIAGELQRVAESLLSVNQQGLARRDCLPVHRGR